MGKLFKYVVLTVFLSFMISNKVFAEQYINDGNFDYEWYLEKHPDLALITDADDKEMIWEFYENVGKPAGWVGRIAKDQLLSFNRFDYQMYAYENPDVVAVHGVNWSRLYQHYMTIGRQEGRHETVREKYREQYEAELKVYEIAEEITRNCSTDREKVKIVHDWMVSNIKYDYENSYTGSIPLRSFHIEGAMLYGMAVCQGYAETFELFMNVLGIECETVCGKAQNSDGWGAHEWNKVKLDGTWYYIDVTWDAPVNSDGGTIISYDYYLKTDVTFGGNHVETGNVLILKY